MGFRTKYYKLGIGNFKLKLDKTDESEQNNGFVECNVDTQSKWKELLHATM